MSAETMVLPAIPDFIEDLDISYEDSSWILAALLVMGAVMTPIAGKTIRYIWKKEGATDNFRGLYIRSFTRSNGN